VQTETLLLRQVMHIGTSLRGGSAVKRCKHGFVSSPEEERICAEVIQEFQFGHNDDVSRLAEVILAAISATQEEYAHVWNGSTEKVVSYEAHSRWKNF
jgi:hypothetical protein